MAISGVSWCAHEHDGLQLMRMSFGREHRFCLPLSTPTYFPRSYEDHTKVRVRRCDIPACWLLSRDDRDRSDPLDPSARAVLRLGLDLWSCAPKTVSTTSRCPDGAAKVETQLSFVNGLVGLLTLGIYTPMHIRVTCAQGSAATGAMLEVPADATVAAVQATFGSAATLAVVSRQPVLVRYTR